MMQLRERYEVRLADPLPVPALLPERDTSKDSIWRGWNYQETGVEVYNALITLAWGLHMLRQPESVGAEPIARAMHQVAHIPIGVMGVIIVTLSITQLIGTYYLDTVIRRACLLGQGAFFVFCMLTFWKFATGYPGAFICVSYVFCSWRRLWQLFGKKE